MFTRVIHADWSANPAGRWAAVADKQAGRWVARMPEPVPPLDSFVGSLHMGAAREPTLALFDFPIGLPIAYGEQTGFDGFPQALQEFAPAFYEIAETPGEVSQARPFYPKRTGGARHQHLLDGHGVAGMSDLTRRCERGGHGLRAAGCLFWTLGASQVGRGALVGWRHVIGPACRRGAHLWPFDGTLNELAARGGLTLGETYPADGYARLGAPFASRESKRRVGDRAGKASAIEHWAERHDVELVPALRTALRDGFGAKDRGGDAFDAAIGLLAALDALDQGCEAPTDAAVRRWEGWILGRPDPL